MTRRELAAKVSLHWARIADLENDQVEANDLELFALCRALDFPLAQFRIWERTQNLCGGDFEAHVLRDCSEAEKDAFIDAL